MSFPFKFHLWSYNVPLRECDEGNHALVFQLADTKLRCFIDPLSAHRKMQTFEKGCLPFLSEQT